MKLRWNIPISFRAGAIVFGASGVLLLSYAVYSGYRRHVALSTWPRIEARVDSGRVAAWEDDAHRQAIYVERLWLVYEVGGRRYTEMVTGEPYSSDYGAAMRAVRRALGARTVPVMVDPADPRDVTLDPGYTWRYFFTQLVTGGLGLFFLGFGFAFRAFHRAERRHLGAQPAPMSTRHALTVLAVMGLLFVAVAAVAAYLLRERHATWLPAQARIDSTDVVWDQEDSDSDASDIDMFRVRSWLSYSVRGGAYHAPLTSAVSRSDSVGTARRAQDERRKGAVAVLVDPGDPYSVIAAPTSRLGAYWIPALFAGIGIILAAVAAVLAARRRAGADSR